MECQEFLCSRQSKFQNKRNGRWYCSDFCAQQDGKTLAANTKSEKMDSSTTRERGDLWMQSSEGKPVNLSEQARTLNEKHEKPEEDTTEMLNDTEPSEEDHGTPEWPEHQKKLELVTENTEKELILQESSELRSHNSGEESLELMGLLNDSISHLHGLMKSVGQNVKERARMNERIGSLDPQAINSAVNCAKEMREMMKLKLEVSKGFK